MRAFAAPRDSFPTLIINARESVGSSEPVLERPRKLPIVESGVVRRRLLGDRQKNAASVASVSLAFEMRTWWFIARRYLRRDLPTMARR